MELPRHFCSLVKSSLYVDVHMFLIGTYFFLPFLTAVSHVQGFPAI